jgi:hypothetical protein
VPRSAREIVCRPCSTEKGIWPVPSRTARRRRRTGHILSCRFSVCAMRHRFIMLSKAFQSGAPAIPVCLLQWVERRVFGAGYRHLTPVFSMPLCPRAVMARAISVRQPVPHGVDCCLLR